MSSDNLLWPYSRTLTYCGVGPALDALRVTASASAWGPRTEEALRMTLMLIYEANAVREAEAALTFADISDVLGDDALRAELLLAAGAPPLLVNWWHAAGRSGSLSEEIVDRVRDIVEQHLAAT